MAPFPTDPSFPLRSERYWFRGIILASICYGISLSLYLACANLLISRITGSKQPGPTPIVAPTRRRSDIFSLLYASFMFACCTISILVEGVSGENAYVDFRGFPGGPSKYLFDHTFTNVTTLKAAYISFLLCHWAAAGLMIWRCLVIYKCTSRGGETVDWRVPRWVLWMTVPWVLSLASFATGIIFLVQAISPSYLPESIRLMRWQFIWGCIAVALEWILTGMIVIRLLVQRGYVRRAMGEEYCSKYTSIATMLVESSVLLSCFSVFYLVAYGIGSPVMVMLPYILTQITVIAPLMIVYRVISGRAWTQRAIPSLESVSALRAYHRREAATTDSTMHLASGPGAPLSHYQEVASTTDATEKEGSLPLNKSWAPESGAGPGMPKKGSDNGVASESSEFFQRRCRGTVERAGHPERCPGTPVLRGQ